jgi:hypothetical protein
MSNGEDVEIDDPSCLSGEGKIRIGDAAEAVAIDAMRSGDVAIDADAGAWDVDAMRGGDVAVDVDSMRKGDKDRLCLRDGDGMRGGDDGGGGESLIVALLVVVVLV